jgi:anti-sigma regulatory factor (Ser/Thr protein kinase)
VTSIAELYGLRSLASRWLSDAGADQEAIDTVALVLSEACTNAFTHGRTDAVDVEMKIENASNGDEAAIVLSTRHVDHDLARLALPQPTMPAPDAPQGRGLALVGRLVDRMTLRIDPPKVTRTCWVPRVAQQS